MRLVTAGQQKSEIPTIKKIPAFAPRGFATSERRIVFDIHDLDAMLPAPWEWDLKRSTMSFVLARRDNGLDKDVPDNSGPSRSRHGSKSSARVKGRGLPDGAGTPWRDRTRRSAKRPAKNASRSSSSGRHSGDLAAIVPIEMHT